MFKVFLTKCYLDFNKKNDFHILSSKYKFKSLTAYQNNLNYFIEFDIETDENNNINFVPTDGSIELELLGILDYSHRYTYQDLLIVLDEMNSDDISLNIEGFGNFDESDFKKVVKIENIDYSFIISELEKEGIVETKPSNFVLRNDDRKFKIKNDDKYTEFYEVDCLGTLHKDELSEKIKDMYLQKFY